MSRHRRGWGFAAVVAVCLVSTVAAEPAARQELPEPVRAALRTAFGAYEEVRAQLAADKPKLIPAAAAQLTASLRVAMDSAEELPKEVSTLLEEAAVFAETMGETGELEAARQAFGELSRRLLTLAAADPGVVEGWHVFKCPMAEGFDRWLQPGEKMANPYMGQAMLECGFEVELVAPPPADPAEAAVAKALEVAREAEEEASAVLEVPGMSPVIPGLKMIDVRDHKTLWRDFDQLQIWESRNVISVAEFRAKAIEKTAEFLGLEGEKAKRFTEETTAAIAKLKEARQKRQGVPFSYENREARQDTFPAELDAVVASFQTLLEDKPRHQLFAPACKEWLLRLTLGPNNRKEAREAQQARAEKP